MKQITLLLLILAPVLTKAQIITTVAGGGTAWLGDDSLATEARLSVPCHAIKDVWGNLYIADYGNNRIRKVDTAGIITTFAGNGTGIHGGDGGPATLAGIDGPQGVAVDKYGNIYIAEDTVDGIGKPWVRKVNTAGVITTIIGNGNAAYSGDGGPATAAGLTPTDLAIDTTGNIYIADFWNNRIRKVDLAGIINTVAGNGTSGYSGDNGPATLAQIDKPYGIAVDAAGNIYIADEGNSRIRKVGTDGIITTIAGNGIGDFSGDGGPATAAEFTPYGVSVDNIGNVYIADAAVNRIRKVDIAGTITTIAGNGNYNHTGDGAPATAAGLYDPIAVSADQLGNIYITEYVGQTIRKISAATTNVTTPSFPGVDILILPNPTTTSLTIQSPSPITTISITNLLGQTIYTNNYNSPQVQVDVSTFPSGIYFVKVNGTEVRKFAKE